MPSALGFYRHKLGMLLGRIRPLFRYGAMNRLITRLDGGTNGNGNEYSSDDPPNLLRLRSHSRRIRTFTAGMLGDQTSLSPNTRQGPLLLSSHSYLLSHLLYAIHEPDRCRVGSSPLRRTRSFVLSHTPLSPPSSRCFHPTASTISGNHWKRRPPDIGRV